MVAPIAKDLLMKMLEKDPKKRITAEMALQHEFLSNFRELQQEMDDTCVDDDLNDGIDERIQRMN